MGNQVKHLYVFGAFRLDTSEQRLSRDGQPVPLTPKSYETLLALVSQNGHMLSKDELMNLIWAESFVEEANLTVTISALRKALGETASEHQYIETVPKRGYRFVAQVTDLANNDIEVKHAPNSQDDVEQTNLRAGETCDESDHMSVAPNAQLITHNEELGTARTTIIDEFPAHAIKTHRRGVAIALLTLFIVSVSVAAYFFHSAGTGKEINSIAVLPFINENADPNLEYLSDGIPESLINRLSQAPNLKVMSRNSAFRYKGREVDAKTIGRDLGVRAILLGKVVQREDKLSINVELVDALDNTHIWGGQYDRRRADVLAVQEEISQAITEKLRLNLTGDEQRRINKRYTANAEYLFTCPTPEFVC